MSLPTIQRKATTCPADDSQRCNKKRSRDSDDWSSAASSITDNNHGRQMLHDKLRSVLSHPWGLSLVYALHDKDLSTLPYLRMERHELGWEKVTKLNSVLENAMTNEGQISYLKAYHRLGGWFPREAKDPASVR